MDELCFQFMGPSFYSRQDEEYFFDWIRKVSPAGIISGSGQYIRVAMPDRDINQASIRELVSLASRYRIDLSSIAHLAQRPGFEWLAKVDCFWRPVVFGQGAKS